MDGIEALRNCLLRMKSQKQDGYMGYKGNGEWHFVSTGLPQVTPEELNALFELVGVIPYKIESKGSCKECKHAVNGREPGYIKPCLYCIRPSMSNFEPKTG